MRLHLYAMTMARAGRSCRRFCFTPSHSLGIPFVQLTYPPATPLSTPHTRFFLVTNNEIIKDSGDQGQLAFISYSHVLAAFFLGLT